MKKTEELKAEIERLALFDKVEYELIREEVANKFSIRIAMLDECVEKSRTKTEEQKSETALFPKIEAWPEKIILSELLNEIVEILKKYVSFNSNHEPKAIALWVIHTYCIEAAYITPILFITSPEMRSGKSTLLSILQKIVFKCVAASSVSPSVIYRLIPKHHPTLICDEADTYLTDRNEDLRGVLNAGHSRDTSGVLRTNPDTLEPERFDAFGAKCLAAIKGLPGTIEDRSIIIKMRRKAKGKKTEKLKLVEEKLRKEFQSIQRKCVKFAHENIKKLKETNPILPDKLNDRAADNWYSLFQIAELAEEPWLKYANEAAPYLSGNEHENKSLGIELLEDIGNLFDGKFKTIDQIPTIELINALCADEEAPWGAYNSKSPDTKIRPRQLSSLLRPYEIKPINNIGFEKRKGYSKNSFQDAFDRYLNSERSDFAATAATAATAAQPSDELYLVNKETSATNAPSAPNFENSSNEADQSESEQQNFKSEKTSEPAPDKERADGADIAAMLIDDKTYTSDHIDI